MSELTLKTRHWSLQLWCADPGSRRNRLAATLAARGKDALPPCQVRFSPALDVLAADNTVIAAHTAEYCLDPQAFLFENLAYEFEFKFPLDNGVDPAPPPRIRHPLASIENSFRLRGDTLRGMVQTGNDIGWLALTLEYHLGGRLQKQMLSLRIYPVKMDIDSDIPLISEKLDKQYPLWRFAFARPTLQDAGSSKARSQRFPLFWLAQLARLQQSLEQAVRTVLDAPHSRLQGTVMQCKADRLRGRLSPQLEEHVAGDLRNGLKHRHYLVEKKHLQTDTPENRFVKMVLLRTGRDLQRIAADITRQYVRDGNPDEGRLSTGFNDGLQENAGRLLQLAARPFFRDIGMFTGMNSDSLVLHHRHGYATIYRIWLELRRYLDVAGRHGEVSLKTIAELYEVWCLLALREQLENLGFYVEKESAVRLDRHGMEMQLQDGSNAVFQLVRGCGLKLRLAHEPAFGTKEDSNGIFSWTTRQRPDIVLEAEFPDGRRLHWIFDAKYRIDSDKDKGDLAPEDAINQMHRYRDALVMKIGVDEANQERKTNQRRPVLGAFVLYPGFHDEKPGGNPYQKGIEKIGIGAFPLLPGHNNRWLADFLADTFGSSGFTYPDALHDVHDLHDATKVCTYNLSLSKHPDLTLIAPVAPSLNRSTAYIDGFREGTASWYHIPLKTLCTIGRRKPVRNSDTSIGTPVSAADISYLALLVSDGQGRHIPWIYPVVGHEELCRKEITILQAGSEAEQSKAEERYVIFKLGKSKRCLSDLRAGVRHTSLRLVSIADIPKAGKLDDLPQHYLFDNRKAMET